jgi:hypothetical protein
LYLVAGSAVTGGLDWTTHRELCVKAMALGAYIVGVSLAARYESRAHLSPTGKASKLQQAVGGLSLLAPAVVALWYAGVHEAGPAVVFAVASLVIVHTALNWMRENPKWIGRAVSLLLASICLVDAAAVASVDLIAPLLCLVAMQVAVLAQRKIAAT